MNEHEIWKLLQIVLFSRNFQSFEYSQSAGPTNTAALPSSAMYPPLPGYSKSPYPPAPIRPFSGQLLNPNVASYPPPQSGGTDFDEEPPLLEGI